MKKTQIVITSGFRWTYFEWFLLGFYQMPEVEVRFKLPFLFKLLTLISNEFLCSVITIISRKYMREKDSNNMDGYILFPDGTKRTFTIDSADAPFLFDAQKLKTVDVYFKMQCPRDLDAPGFRLTDDVLVPWSDHAHVDKSLKYLTDRGARKVLDNFSEYHEKIKPLMIGPRCLSRSLTKKALERSYRHFIGDRSVTKSGRVMCYFGNSMGPVPEAEVTDVDWDWEKDIMAFLKGKGSHPNEKRAVVAKYIQAMDSRDNCDARVIREAHSDGEGKTNKDKVVSRKDFCAHVAKFQYNYNVSGYRMSIPNRFIESFMVGTAIVTDKLAVKWYKPFNACEVIETVPMGYLPMEKVDWQSVERDLKSLPQSEPEKIIASFNEKWRPDVVAKYIIDALRDA